MLKYLFGVACLLAIDDVFYLIFSFIRCKRLIGTHSKILAPIMELTPHVQEKLHAGHKVTAVSFLCTVDFLLICFYRKYKSSHLKFSIL